jgi:hypothetical protein
MLPDAYTDNTNWTKDDEGKSKLILNPRLLRPSFFNDLSLQIKRSMVVGDLKILFRGKDNFEEAHDERSAKQIMLSNFSRTGNLTDLVEVPSTDIQVPVGYRTKIMGYGGVCNLLSKFRFDYDDISKYALRLLMNTDLTKEQVLGVVETFKAFKESKPMGSAPRWKNCSSLLGHDDWTSASITRQIWTADKRFQDIPMKHFNPCKLNKELKNKRGWESFKNEEDNYGNWRGTRPNFFHKRNNDPKVKKNASSEEVCEWFFHQLYLIVNNNCPYQKSWRNRQSPDYDGLDRATRDCIASGWDRVKSKSKIDIQDEFRIFAMPEYKIKQRTYESIVNSITW